METTIVYWGSIAIMEKKMETTIVYCRHPEILKAIIASQGFHQKAACVEKLPLCFSCTLCLKIQPNNGPDACT